MKLMKEPDEVKEHYPAMCIGCANAENCHARIAERRYETDIVVESRLIEHRQMVCCCPMRENKEITGTFPDNITGTKQYGYNLKAFAAALSTVGMVSIDRIHQLLSSVFQVIVSTGAIQNWIRQLSASAKDAVERIREYVSNLQRELVYADEQMKQSWAKPLHDLLNEMLHRRKELQALGRSGFTQEEWDGYSLKYDMLIRQGFLENPIPEKAKGKRGRPGKGKMICLLERFRDYKADILRFATDWNVPFTNNEAERSIRFSKVKQKVSGCFRTEDGAKDYMQIMSYISSCQKHGIGYFEAVRKALAGNALALVTQWG